MWILNCENKHYWTCDALQEICPECGKNANAGSRILGRGHEESIISYLESQGCRQVKPKPSEEGT